MTAPLTEQEFSRHIDTIFRAKLDDGGSVDLRLVQVEPYKHKDPEDTDVQQFSAFFLGDGKVVLAQRIYNLQHDKMGDFDLFIVPIGRTAEGTRYEAVFNFIS